jgi:hypothetical protein
MGCSSPVIAVVLSRSRQHDAQAELFFGRAVEQAQQLSVEPAWALLAALPLGHHLSVHADSQAEVLPGQPREFFRDLL